jgi:hypothetical protein
MDNRPRLQPGIKWHIKDERVEDTLRSRRLIETPTCYMNRFPRLKSGSCRLNTRDKLEFPRMGQLARRRKLWKSSFPCPKWKAPGTTRPNQLDLVAPWVRSFGVLSPVLSRAHRIAPIPRGSWLNLKQLIEPQLKAGELIFTRQR